MRESLECHSVNAIFSPRGSREAEPPFSFSSAPRSPRISPSSSFAFSRSGKAAFSSSSPGASPGRVHTGENATATLSASSAAPFRFGRFTGGDSRDLSARRRVCDAQPSGREEELQLRAGRMWGRGGEVTPGSGENSRMQRDAGEFLGGRPGSAERKERSPFNDEMNLRPSTRASPTADTPSRIPKSRASLGSSSCSSSSSSSCSSTSSFDSASPVERLLDQLADLEKRVSCRRGESRRSPGSFLASSRREFLKLSSRDLEEIAACLLPSVRFMAFDQLTRMLAALASLMRATPQSSSSRLFSSSTLEPYVHLLAPNKSSARSGSPCLSPSPSSSLPSLPSLPLRFFPDRAGLSSPLSGTEPISAGDRTHSAFLQTLRTLPGDSSTCVQLLRLTCTAAIACLRPSSSSSSSSSPSSSSPSASSSASSTPLSPPLCVPAASTREPAELTLASVLQFLHVVVSDLSLSSPALFRRAAAHLADESPLLEHAAPRDCARLLHVFMKHELLLAEQERRQASNRWPSTAKPAAPLGRVTASNQPPNARLRSPSPHAQAALLSVRAPSPRSGASAAASPDASTSPWGRLTFEHALTVPMFPLADSPLSSASVLRVFRRLAARLSKLQQRHSAVFKERAALEETGRVLQAKREALHDRAESWRDAEARDGSLRRPAGSSQVEGASAREGAGAGGRGEREGRRDGSETDAKDWRELEAEEKRIAARREEVSGNDQLLVLNGQDLAMIFDACIKMRLIDLRLFTLLVTSSLRTLLQSSRNPPHLPPLARLSPSSPSSLSLSEVSPFPASGGSARGAWPREERDRQCTGRDWAALYGQLVCLLKLLEEAQSHAVSVSVGLPSEPGTSTGRAAAQAASHPSPRLGEGRHPSPFSSPFGSPLHAPTLSSLSSSPLASSSRSSSLELKEQGERPVDSGVVVLASRVLPFLVRDVPAALGREKLMSLHPHSLVALVHGSSELVRFTARLSDKDFLRILSLAADRKSEASSRQSATAVDDEERCDRRVAEPWKRLEWVARCVARKGAQNAEKSELWRMLKDCHARIMSSAFQFEPSHISVLLSAYANLQQKLPSNSTSASSSQSTLEGDHWRDQGELSGRTEDEILCLTDLIASTTFTQRVVEVVPKFVVPHHCATTLRALSLFLSTHAAVTSSSPSGRRVSPMALTASSSPHCSSSSLLSPSPSPYSSASSERHGEASSGREPTMEKRDATRHAANNAAKLFQALLGRLLEADSLRTKKWTGKELVTLAGAVARAAPALLPLSSMPSAAASLASSAHRWSPGLPSPRGCSLLPASFVSFTSSSFSPHPLASAPSSSAPSSASSLLATGLAASGEEGSFGGEDWRGRLRNSGGGQEEHESERRCAEESEDEDDGFGLFHASLSGEDKSRPNRVAAATASGACAASPALTSPSSLHKALQDEAQSLCRPSALVSVVPPASLSLSLDFQRLSPSAVERKPAPCVVSQFFASLAAFLLDVKAPASRASTLPEPSRLAPQCRSPWGRSGAQDFEETSRRLSPGSSEAPCGALPASSTAVPAAGEARPPFASTVLEASLPSPNLLVMMMDALVSAAIAFHDWELLRRRQETGRLQAKPARLGKELGACRSHTADAEAEGEGVEAAPRWGDSAAVAGPGDPMLFLANEDDATRDVIRLLQMCGHLLAARHGQDLTLLDVATLAHAFSKAPLLLNVFLPTQALSAHPGLTSSPLLVASSSFSSPPVAPNSSSSLSTSLTVAPSPSVSPSISPSISPSSSSSISSSISSSVSPSVSPWGTPPPVPATPTGSVPALPRRSGVLSLSGSDMCVNPLLLCLLTSMASRRTENLASFSAPVYALVGSGRAPASRQPSVSLASRRSRLAVSVALLSTLAKATVASAPGLEEQSRAAAGQRYAAAAEDIWRSEDALSGRSAGEREGEAASNATGLDTGEAAGRRTETLEAQLERACRAREKRRSLETPGATEGEKKGAPGQDRVDRWSDADATAVYRRMWTHPRTCDVVRETAQLLREEGEEAEASLKAWMEKRCESGNDRSHSKDLQAFVASLTVLATLFQQACLAVSRALSSLLLSPSLPSWSPCSSPSSSSFSSPGLSPFPLASSSFGGGGSVASAGPPLSVSDSASPAGNSPALPGHVAGRETRTKSVHGGEGDAGERHRKEEEDRKREGLGVVHDYVSLLLALEDLSAALVACNGALLGNSHDRANHVEEAESSSLNLSKTAESTSRGMAVAALPHSPEGSPIPVVPSSLSSGSSSSSFVPTLPCDSAPSSASPSAASGSPSPLFRILSSPSAEGISFRCSSRQAAQMAEGIIDTLLGLEGLLLLSRHPALAKKLKVQLPSKRHESPHSTEETPNNSREETARTEAEGRTRRRRRPVVLRLEASVRDIMDMQRMRYREENRGEAEEVNRCRAFERGDCEEVDFSPTHRAYEEFYETRIERLLGKATGQLEALLLLSLYNDATSCGRKARMKETRFGAKEAETKDEEFLFSLIRSSRLGLCLRVLDTGRIRQNAFLLQTLRDHLLCRAVTSSAFRARERLSHECIVRPASAVAASVDAHDSSRDSSSSLPCSSTSSLSSASTSLLLPLSASCTPSSGPSVASSVLSSRLWSSPCPFGLSRSELCGVLMALASLAACTPRLLSQLFLLCLGDQTAPSSSDEENEPSVVLSLTHTLQFLHTYTVVFAIPQTPASVLFPSDASGSFAASSPSSASSSVHASICPSSFVDRASSLRLPNSGASSPSLSPSAPLSASRDVHRSARPAKSGSRYTVDRLVLQRLLLPFPEDLLLPRLRSQLRLLLVHALKCMHSARREFGRDTKKAYLPHRAALGCLCGDGEGQGNGETTAARSTAADGEMRSDKQGRTEGNGTAEDGDVEGEERVLFRDEHGFLALTASETEKTIQHLLLALRAAATGLFDFPVSAQSMDRRHSAGEVYLRTLPLPVLRQARDLVVSVHPFLMAANPKQEEVLWQVSSVASPSLASASPPSLFASSLADPERVAAPAVASPAAASIFDSAFDGENGDTTREDAPHNGQEFSVFQSLAEPRILDRRPLRLPQSVTVPTSRPLSSSFPPSSPSSLSSDAPAACASASCVSAPSGSSAGSSSPSAASSSVSPLPLPKSFFSPKSSRYHAEVRDALRRLLSSELVKEEALRLRSASVYPPLDGLSEVADCTASAEEGGGKLEPRQRRAERDKRDERDLREGAGAVDVCTPSKPRRQEKTPPSLKDLQVISEVRVYPWYLDLLILNGSALKRCMQRRN
ncbi:hypothetical protein TGVAND_314920 [Toxoplasma gondii VAND]|uniref:Uncharacterized protein n=1 Tax=Toxoplasma gondii VAND TaxID=933077 RepID=A0A086PP97_TOXGO|nr:hypothetical protein TGVAND_314920 [Toxoplasma gondii VAND]